MGYYYIKTDYLEHSSGPWKKHKHANKTKKNGKWVYTYPGDSDPDYVRLLHQISE